MRCIAVLWVAAVLADDSLYSLAFKTLESTKTGHIQTQPQSKWESLMNILFSDKALLSGSNQKDHIPNWERFTEIPVINIKDTAIDKKDKALKLLHHAAYSENDTQAMALLGDIFLFKKYSIARNATLAFSHYFALADTGATRGNSMIGIMYATGIGVPRDYIKALVFLNLAALDRDSQALQVLGYWHLQGITVSKSCTESLKFYRQLADKVVEIYRSSPNERKRLPHDFVAHSDNFGGIYGKDSGGSGNPAASKKELKISDKDLLTIHQVQADGGDAVSQFLTARYFYEGSRSIKVDLKKALHYFGLAAKQHPGLEASKEKGASTFIKHAATAASESHGYLGDMYFRGEGVEQNLEFARKWYERGAALENGASLNGMGVMHMKGLGGLEKNSDLALKYLKESAAKENAEGQPKQDTVQILGLFSKAAKYGHPLAYYYSANLVTDKSQSEKAGGNCRLARQYYKLLVEDSSWHVDYMENGYSAFMANDMETAFLNYYIAAELGYQVAQKNAAWMLDAGFYKSTRNSRLIFSENGEPWDPYFVALPLWMRSANQNDVDSRVKVGDYLYYGLGNSKRNIKLEEPKPPSLPDPDPNTPKIVKSDTEIGIPAAKGPSIKVVDDENVKEDEAEKVQNAEEKSEDSVNAGKVIVPDELKKLMLENQTPKDPSNSAEPGSDINVADEQQSVDNGPHSADHIVSNSDVKTPQSDKRLITEEELEEELKVLELELKKISPVTDPIYESQNTDNSKQLASGEPNSDEKLDKAKPDNQDTAGTEGSWKDGLKKFDKAADPVTDSQTRNGPEPPQYAAKEVNTNADSPERKARVAQPEAIEEEIGEAHGVLGLTNHTSFFVYWFNLNFGIRKYEPDYKGALMHYTNAAETGRSSMAMYNMGYMYEYGIATQQVFFALTQDFHLAKRWYDLAKTTNPGAYLPIQIALFRMRIRQYLLSAEKPITKAKFVPPIPTENDQVDEKTWLLSGGLFFEILILVVLCISAGILFYARRQLLRRPLTQ